MRLIDADAERERLKKGYCEECTRKGNYGIFGVACTPCWVKDAIEEFDNAQTVEAEPVRHGRWIFHEQKSGYLWKCSGCNGNFNQKYRYCPFCGANMEGGE